MRRINHLRFSVVLLVLVLFNARLNAQVIGIDAHEVAYAADNEQLSAKLRAWRTYAFTRTFSTPSLQTRQLNLRLGQEEITINGYHSPVTDFNSALVVLTEQGTQRRRFPELLYLNNKTSRITVGNNFILGEYEYNGQQYMLERLKNFDPSAPDDIIITYRKEDVIENPAIQCGTVDNSQLSRSAFNSSDGALKAPANTNCRTTEIAILANSTTYVFHGSNVEATAAYIASIYNLTEGDYTDEFSTDIKFKINELVISTSTLTNPWPHSDDPGVNLGYFNAWGQSGFKSENDLTSYWSYTRNFSSGVVGIAYVGFTCRAPGDAVIREYGSGAQAMRCLLSHEHGHNFNLKHDVAGAPFIMAPSVSTTNVDFSAESKTTFESYLQSPSMACITECSFTACERTAPTNLNIVYNAATHKIRSSWIVDPQASGYIIRWWPTGSTTVSTDTIGGTLGVYEITLPCNAAKQYRVEVAVLCESGIAGEYRGVEVMNGAIPNISISGSTSICTGGTVTLSSSITSGNQWYKNNVLITGAISKTYIANATGSYTVKATNATGCISTSAAVAVTLYTIPAKPLITASGPLTFCNGGRVVLTSSAGSGNQWLKSGAIIAGATGKSYTVTTAGVYSVKATNGGTCSAVSDAKTVVVNPLPAVPVITASGTLKLCPGGKVVLTSSAASLNQWYKNNVAIAGATGRTYQATSAGAYLVKARSAAGCETTSAAVTVTYSENPVKPLITASGPLNFCEGGNVILTSSAPSGHQWFKNGILIPGAAGKTYRVIASGKYTVKTTNAGGCFAISDATTVTVFTMPPIPVTVPAGNLAICSGQELTITSSTAVTYQWYKNNVLIPGATLKTFKANSSGRYSVVTGNVNGCKTTSLPLVLTVNVIPAKPVVKITGNLQFCAGQSVVFTSPSLTGNQWFKDGRAIDTGTARVFVAKVAGKYFLKLSNTLGCFNYSDTFEVKVNAVPPTPRIIASGALTFCTGKDITLTSSATSGNQWYKNDVAIPGAVNTTLKVAEGGRYKLIVTNTLGCSAASLPAEVVVNALPAVPVITANGPLTICSGSKLTLTSSAASGNQWLKNGVVITGATTNIYDVTLAGQYSVRVTNTAGCTQVSLPVTLAVNASPVKPTIVFSSNKLVTVAGYSNYKWYLNGVLIAGATTNSYQPLADGIYKVSVTGINGCVSTSDDFVKQSPLNTRQLRVAGKLQVFPNPARDVLNIVFENEGNRKLSLKLFDMQGRLYLSETMSGTVHSISTSKLPGGVYQVVITDGKIMEQSKVVIAR
jgi:hypothetical protein